MNKLFHLLAGLAIFDPQLNTGQQNIDVKKVDIGPVEKPIPKGCQRYYYDDYGRCPKEISVIHFDALSQERAFKKFKAWQLKQ